MYFLYGMIGAPSFFSGSNYPESRILAIQGNCRMLYFGGEKVACDLRL